VVNDYCSCGRLYILEPDEACPDCGATDERVSYEDSQHIRAEQREGYRG